MTKIILIQLLFLPLLLNKKKLKRKHGIPWHVHAIQKLALLRSRKSHFYVVFSGFFFHQVFFHGHWRLTGQQGKGGEHLLFHSTTSTLSRTFRYFFTTLQVRWLSHIFNRTACIYQTATRWDLPPYRINIWLIHDVMFFVWLLDDLILGFCYSNLRLETGGLELALPITFVLQANRLTKCASYPCCLGHGA